MLSWQKGKDRMFFKNNVYIALEAKREELRKRACLVIQRRTRGMLTRRLLQARSLILLEIDRCLAEKDWNGLDEAVEAGKAAGLPSKRLNDAVAQRVRITQITMANLTLIKCMAVHAVVTGDMSLQEHLLSVKEKTVEARQAATHFDLDGHKLGHGNHNFIISEQF